jgi:hypothetical protein
VGTQASGFGPPSALPARLEDPLFLAGPAACHRPRHRQVGERQRIVFYDDFQLRRIATRRWRRCETGDPIDLAGRRRFTARTRTRYFRNAAISVATAS